MSRSDLERLLEDVRKDPSLMEDLRCRVHDRDSAIEWARQRGYVLGSEDVTALADSDRELSDDELEDAAGGDWGSGGTTPPPTGP
jgi:predicted ribosomally synthesized peptide with nif11-like leader